MGIWETKFADCTQITPIPNDGHWKSVHQAEKKEKVFKELFYSDKSIKVAFTFLPFLIPLSDDKNRSPQNLFSNSVQDSRVLMRPNKKIGCFVLQTPYFIDYPKDLPSGSVEQTGSCSCMLITLISLRKEISQNKI